MKRFIYIMYTLFLTLFVSGCATTPNVGYVSKSVQQVSKGVSIQVKDFDDSRPASDRGKLGGRYNEYGMKMGDVLEPSGLIVGLKEAFITELKKNGYSISSDAHELSLSVNILAVGCDQRTNQTAYIRATVVLRDRGQEVINNVYSGDSSIFFTFDATGSDVLNKAIEKLVVNFTKDLNEYVKT